MHDVQQRVPKGEPRKTQDKSYDKTKLSCVGKSYGMIIQILYFKLLYHFLIFLLPSMTSVVFVCFFILYMLQLASE